MQTISRNTLGSEHRQRVRGYDSFPIRHANRYGRINRRDIAQFSPEPMRRRTK